MVILLTSQKELNTIKKVIVQYKQGIISDLELYTKVRDTYNSKFNKFKGNSEMVNMRIFNISDIKEVVDYIYTTSFSDFE